MPTGVSVLPQKRPDTLDKSLKMITFVEYCSIFLTEQLQYIQFKTYFHVSFHNNPYPYQKMNITYISKENSLMLKGLAMLFMVILHLYRPENMQDAFSLCTVQGKPLASWLASGCSPVGLYLFMSGYGLYYTYRVNNRRGGVFLRIIKLYKLYWLTLLVFLPIAHILFPSSYPGNWQRVIANVTAFRAEWNAEVWFLFPYILLVLSCKWIFALLDKMGAKKMLVGTYILYLISIFIVSRCYEPFFGRHYSSYSIYALYHIVLYFDCLFMFVMGAIFCKYAQHEFKGRVARLLALPPKVLLLLFVLVFLSGCALKYGAIYGPFLQAAMIILFVRINWFGFIKKGFRFLGQYSTVVWLIHTWICYYCFKDLIYSLHYPILMLLVTLTVSIIIGHAIMLIDKYTNRALHIDKKRT